MSCEAVGDADPVGCAVTGWAGVPPVGWAIGVAGAVTGWLQQHWLQPVPNDAALQLGSAELAVIAPVGQPES